MNLKRGELAKWTARARWQTPAGDVRNMLTQGKALEGDLALTH